MPAATVLSSVVACAIAGSSTAPPATIPVIDLTFTLDGCPIDVCSNSCGELVPLDDGTFRFIGAIQIDGLPPANWDILFDPDPFVIANLNVVNNSTVETAGFTITVGMPITPVENGVAYGSLVGTLTDGLSDGAELSSWGDSPLYIARIDGSPFAELVPAPFGVVAAPFGTAIVGPFSFGDPPDPVESARDSIGVTLTFDLTPGDSCALSAIFFVEPEDNR